LANELIINRGSSGTEIALLCDKQLTEFHKDSDVQTFAVGDIYLGTVRKMMQGLNAAFIDVGHAKDGFLHYHDLGPNVLSVKKLTRIGLAGSYPKSDLDTFTLEKKTQKTGKISGVLKKGDQVLVQVAKEPISSKGPKISMDISIAGRFFILVPFTDQVSISRKVGNPEEKQRLKNLAQSLKPKNFGIIIRTVAEGTPVEELHKDLLDLQERWDKMFKSLKDAKPRQKVHGESGRTQALLRDILNEDFSQIVVNDKELSKEIKAFVDKISPGNGRIVKHHSKDVSIFEHYNINRQIKSSFGKSVSFSKGCYLIIEHTEALHVIDVNSGSKSNPDMDSEENALFVNKAAAVEIARQLRLRDMGGIVVIDFIDVRNPNNKKELYNAMQDAMAGDRAKHTILPMSKFGLIQITRQRVRPEVNIITTENCPSCNGTGKIEAAILIEEKITSQLEYLWQNLNHKKITIIVHPYIASFLKVGFPSIRLKWFMEYKRWLNIVVDENMHISDSQILNEKGEEIDVS
jgi:ribonuclease G